MTAAAAVWCLSAGSMTNDRVIAQLLTEMDGINPTKNVFIIGATNRYLQLTRAYLLTYLLTYQHSYHRAVITAIEMLRPVHTSNLSKQQIDATRRKQQVRPYVHNQTQCSQQSK